MPRRSIKKPVAAPVAEITAAEAVALWREAGGKGLADASTATTMAEALNALIGHRSWETERGRRYADHADAIRAALRALQSIEAEITTVARGGHAELANLPPLTRPHADRLRADLRRLLDILAPAASSRPPWADCASAAWFVAVHAGAPRSPARTALAVKFAALATRRLGFVGATPKAIAMSLRRTRFPWEIESSHRDAETDTPRIAMQRGGKT